jgi:DNA-binding response OmpR family regulator
MIQFDCSVLIVEDDEDLREILQDILKRLGLSIQMASDGEMALKLIKINQFDLVLSDVSMPKKNGFTLLQDLRNDPDIVQPKLCFISAGIDASDDNVRLLAGKFDGILLKPFRHDVIVEKLRELFPDKIVSL